MPKQLTIKEYQNLYGIAEQNNIMVTVAQDGTGDYNGTDEVPIQAAINYLNSNGGGSVFIKKGNYNITNTITLLTNVHIKGENMGSVVLTKNASLESDVFVDNTDSIENFSLTDITIDINLSEKLGTIEGLNLSQTNSYFEIKNIKFLNGSQRCASISNCTHFLLENLNLYSYDCQESELDGIDINSCSKFKILNCYGETGDDLFAISSSNNYIINNLIRKNSEAGSTLKLNILTGADHFNVNASNIVNYSPNTVPAGSFVLQCNDPTKLGYNMNISNITNYGGYDAVKIQDVSTVSPPAAPVFKNISISNVNHYDGGSATLWINAPNIIENSTFSNINSYGCVHGIKLNGGTDLVFNNVFIYGSSAYSIYINESTQDDIKNITFNNVENNSGVKIYVTTEYSADNYIIFNNVKTNATTGIDVLSTAYVVCSNWTIRNASSYGVNIRSGNNFVAKNFTFYNCASNLRVRPLQMDDCIFGSSAPSSTPEYIGQKFIDYNNDKLYVATGTGSSADWIILN